MLKLSVTQPDWTKAITELVMTEEEKIRLVLEAVGVELVAYLKSYNIDRPVPGKARTGPFHPGGWRDITHVLVNSYEPPQVVKVANGWKLILSNTAEYAIYLELRDGFYVLSGIFDPKGPLADALRTVVPQVAPGWRLDLGRLQFGHPTEQGA